MKPRLPVDDFLDKIQNSLKTKQNLVVIASPGAGKTTRIPPSLVTKNSLKILMLQPRRIAARSAAERIADENQWKLGEEVGYRVRFEDCTSKQTKLVIVTEALLMRELIKDPNLSEYGTIILDEFHERNLYTDAGLAAIRELQLLHRSDLKLIVMSATMDPKPLIHYLESVELIEIPGRAFPVEVFYDHQAQSLNTGPQFIERVTSKIIESLSLPPIERENSKSESITHTDDFLDSLSDKKPRHTLVFLPGVSEILRVQKNILTHPSWSKYHRNLFILHGGLNLNEQHNVLHSPHSKVILATNVAETSLTIDGVDTVIDSGLSRELQWDQRRLFPWLKTSRISKASAEQRKGRAGRQYPGRCFRLWTKLDEQSMPNFASPDITNQDLTDLILTLIHLGISDPINFSWFEKPSAQNIDRSTQLLFQLGILNNPSPPFNLSSKGEWIQKIPLSTRLASLIHEGDKINHPLLATQIAVLLNERDPWGKENLESHLAEAQDSDLVPRLEALNHNSNSNKFKFHIQAIKQIQRLLKMKNTVQKNEDQGNHLLSSYDFQNAQTKNILIKLLLSSFSDRIARRRRPGEPTALVVGQKGVELSELSLVRESELFFCLNGHANEKNGNAIVDLAHPLPKNALLEHLNHEIEIIKDERFLPEKDSWMSVEQKYFRDLPIEEPNFKPITISKDNLVMIARQSFSQWKKSIPTLSQWYSRLDFAQKLWPHLIWPDLTLWEQETLEMACMGEQTLQSVQEKHWSELFCLSLSKQQKQIMIIDLPENIVTPKGKTFRLEYDTSGVVNLELKIQDAFGWTQTPQIAQGKIKLRLILLGPHMRPLQTTDDLASFWKGAYQEMRPSLKARYPKHQWPENPALLK